MRVLIVYERDESGDTKEAANALAAAVERAGSELVAFGELDDVLPAAARGAEVLLVGTRAAISVFGHGGGVGRRTRSWLSILPQVTGTVAGVLCVALTRPDAAVEEVRSELATHGATLEGRLHVTPGRPTVGAATLVHEVLEAAARRHEERGELSRDSESSRDDYRRIVSQPQLWGAQETVAGSA